MTILELKMIGDFQPIKKPTLTSKMSKVKTGKINYKGGEYEGEILGKFPNGKGTMKFPQQLVYF